MILESFFCSLRIIATRLKSYLPSLSFLFEQNRQTPPINNCLA